VFQLTPIVKNLLIINAVMFAVPSLLLHSDDLFKNLFGLPFLFSKNFIPTQLLSYSLIHASWSHLFSNMLGLLVFGPILEMRLGAKRFLFFYFATAFGAALIYSTTHFLEVFRYISIAQEFLADPSPDLFSRVVSESQDLIREIQKKENIEALIEIYERQPEVDVNRKFAISLVNEFIKFRENAPMVGASGAVYGVMLGFGYLFPNLQMMLLFPPIPVRAKYLIGFYAIAALYYAVERVPGDNVAHYAHLGGMLVGWLILRYWKVSPQRY
jgi:membrane associated rhomboid family serine protease